MSESIHNAIDYRSVGGLTGSEAVEIWTGPGVGPAKTSTGALAALTGFVVLVLPAGQPDGVTDNTAAIQAAINAAAGASALSIPARANPYRTSGLVLPSNTRLIIETGATIKLVDRADLFFPPVGRNIYILAIASGAANVLVELYGTLDGNASGQAPPAGTNIGGYGTQGNGTCSGIYLVGDRQGVITNNRNWPHNITSCTDGETSGITMSNSGNSCEFAGISSRISITSGTYDTSTGNVSLTIDPASASPPGAPAPVVGQTFTVTAVAGTGDFIHLQGEWVAAAGTTGTTVNYTAAANLAATTLTGGRVGIATKCFSVGFSNCIVDGIPDLGVGLYGGVVGGFIRDCEVRKCGSAGPFIFCDNGQPGTNQDCTISGCYSHDNLSAGLVIASNASFINNKNITVSDNISAFNSSGGATLFGVVGLRFLNNILHDNYPTVSNTTGSSSTVYMTAVDVDIVGNTIRNPGPGTLSQQVSSVSSGTYNSTTGAVSLTTNTNHNISVGGSFFLSNARGTGAFAALDGWQVATAGTSGTTLNFTTATGLTLTITSAVVLGVVFAVATNTISSGSYTSATGAVTLTTAAPHGYSVGSPFVLTRMVGTGAITDLNGTYVATAGTTGSTLNFTALLGATLTITGGTVLPANFGIEIFFPNSARLSGNNIGDYQTTKMLTAAIGGTWGQNGLSAGNYYGPRNAIMADVSAYAFGSVQGMSYDGFFNTAVGNFSMTGALTLTGNTQFGVLAPLGLVSQGFTVGWNRSSGNGEVDMYVGLGTANGGGYDIVQVSPLTITTGTYNSGTGAVSLTTQANHLLVAGNTIIISAVTGTGADLATLNGLQTLTAGTGGTTLNFTIATGLTITSITGGTVVPQGGTGGVINTSVGVAGSLQTSDGYGNTLIGGARVHGVVQATTLANSGTVTIVPNVDFVHIQNSGSIAAGTIVFPTPSAHSMLLTAATSHADLEVYFDNPVGTLTVTAPGTYSVVNGPTAVAAAGNSYLFLLNGSAWLHRKMS